jgi:glycosyltransferase involved in cell wall biosynthesis
LPVIVSNIPPHREIIGNRENGLLTKVSPRKIAQNIDLLITNKQLRKRLSQQARKTALQQFDIKKTTFKEIKLLKK